MLVALAAIGWLVSYNLTTTSASGEVPAALRLVCGGWNGGDCLSVLTSPRAYLKGTNIPWAAVGMGYFAMVLVWNLFVGPTSRGRGWWHIPPLALVLIAGWFSVDFLNVMANELRRWCAGCVAAHAINALIVLLTIAATPVFRARKPQVPHPSARLALSSIVAGLGVLGVHVFFTTSLSMSNARDQAQRMTSAIIRDPQFVSWDWKRQPVQEIPLRDDEPWVGAPDAKYTAVAFIDFQCPSCRNQHAVLDEFIAAHPGVLRLTIRNFPLNSECNPGAARITHPEACRAALAAEAVREAGGPAALRRFTYVLFSRQADLIRGSFDDWAAASGVSKADFQRVHSSPGPAERVREDAALAKSLGVTAPPTLFINGQRLTYWPEKLEGWERLFDLPAAATKPAP